MPDRVGAPPAWRRRTKATERREPAAAPPSPPAPQLDTQGPKPEGSVLRHAITPVSAKQAILHGPRISAGAPWRRVRRGGATRARADQVGRGLSDAVAIEAGGRPPPAGAVPPPPAGAPPAPQVAGEPKITAARRKKGGSIERCKMYANLCKFTQQLRTFYVLFTQFLRTGVVVTFMHRCKIRNLL